MPRSFLNPDMEELVLGKTTEKFTSVIPDGSSLTVIESGSNVELNTGTSSTNQRAQISATRFSRLMTRTLGASKLRDSCCIVVRHPFFKANDFCFSIDGLRVCLALKLFERIH